MDSGAREEAELSSEDLRRAIDLLAGMGVFHLALGGGEAFERTDFLEIAEHVRRRGMIPNLTTSGRGVTPEVARRCRVFGQVNVSIDGFARFSGAGRDGAAREQALRAVDLLIDAGVRVGVNCVLTRRTLAGLDELFAFAAMRGLEDVELLRLKPSGRAGRGYVEQRLAPEQHVSLFPILRDLSLRHGVAAKIDCSFVPMLCWHGPDEALMDRFSVYGCEAGHVLLGVRSDGRFAGCSFLRGEESVFDLPRLWERSETLARLRSFSDDAREPCRSCRWLRICKGGCRAVAAFVTGDPLAPDPECPFVEARAGGPCTGPG
jgi:radical SAM protein with 4Fe4S-binding SPASM domain